MGKFAVHRCHLFEYQPQAIQCMASYESPDSQKTTKLLAVGRENGAIELMKCTKTGFYTYMVIPGSTKRNLEDLLWCDGRLFSAELQGVISEYDLVKGVVKQSEDSFGGAVWCLASGQRNGMIAAGCEDGSIKIFNCNDGRLMFEKSLDKQDGRILSCSFHPTNEVIVSGAVDVIRVWSYKSGHAIQRIKLETTRHRDTIVWAVKILKDHTIVSGDSTGKVNFWNGKNATLIQSFHNHHADILSLCVSEDESIVYTAGVDPRVIALNHSSNSQESIGAKSWVKGSTMQKHTHDVRSLAILGNYLVSGGVDTNILLTNTVDNKAKKISGFPHKSHVSIASHARMLLLKYPRHLDIWRLATPESVSGNVGDTIPLTEEPTNVVQIKSPASDPDDITCCAISDCGHWLVYSTKSTFRLFRLNWEEENPRECSVTKVPIMWLKSASSIIFTPDSTRVIASSVNGKIYVMKLESNGHAHVEHVFKNEGEIDHQTPANLLRSTNDHLAAVDMENNIKIYDLKKFVMYCSLPRRDFIPTAIAFKPSNVQLLVAYQDHSIVEYDITKKSYTDWCRDANAVNFNLIRFPAKYIHRPKKATKWNVSPIINISFSDIQPETVLLSSSNEIYFLNQSKHLLKQIAEFETEKAAILSHDEKEKNLKIKKLREKLECPVQRFDKFEHLLHTSFLDAGASVLAIERSWDDVFENLPPTLYRKKFGT